MKLLHPFMPFVTEEIWQLVLADGKVDSISTESWPEPLLKFINDDLEKDMDRVVKLAEAVRTACAELEVPPAKKPNVLVKCESQELVDIFNSHTEEIRNLARSGEVTVGTDIAKPPLSASAVIPGAEIYIPLESLIDIDQERSRLQKQLEEKTAYFEKLTRKLGNKDFIDRAPADVVEGEKERLVKTEQLIEKLTRNLESLTGW